MIKNSTFILIASVILAATIPGSARAFTAVLNNTGQMLDVQVIYFLEDPWRSKTEAYTQRELTVGELWKFNDPKPRLCTKEGWNISNYTPHCHFSHLRIYSSSLGEGRITNGPGRKDTVTVGWNAFMLRFMCDDTYCF